MAIEMENPEGDGRVEVLFQANSVLGEGPVWDDRAQVLYWVDIRLCRISRYDPGLRRQTGVWIVPDRVGCLGLTSDPGRLIVGAGTEVFFLDLGSGRMAPVASLPILRDRYRIND